MKKYLEMIVGLVLLTQAVSAEMSAYASLPIGGVVWGFTYDTSSYTAKIGRYSWGYYPALATSVIGPVVIPTIVQNRDFYDILHTYSINEILPFAFTNLTGLTSVTIPKEILSIGRCAFKNCSNVGEFVFEDGGTDLRIYGYAFQNCQKASKLKIPDCTTYIDVRAFENCKRLTSFIIPPSVTFVGANLFSGCDALRTISVDETKFKIERDVLYSNDMETVVCCLRDRPQMKISDTAKSVNDYAFRESLSLESIEIPEGVTNIGQWAFWECKKMTSIVLPESLWKLGWGALGGCSSLSSITIRRNVTAIGGLSLSGCTNLTEVIVDEGDGERILGLLKGSGAANSDWDWSKCRFTEILRVKQPLLSAGTHTFNTVCETVEIFSETEGATIYYTLDGSIPSPTNGRMYRGAFDLYQTATVKAIAVKDGWRDSEVVEAGFTKSNGISEALNCLKMTPETQSQKGWVVDRDVSHDGVSSMRSGAIGNGGMSYLQMSVKGAGRLSFWWKAKCEEPTPEDGKDGYYDYCAFMVGGVDVEYLAGEDTGWNQFVTNITTSGKHVLRWEYRKDDEGSFPPDCVWVDQVQWLSTSATDENDHTLTTEVPIPYTWLDRYGLGRESDFETAASAKTGKVDGCGRIMTVEDDYIAGTDPTNLWSRLTAEVKWVNNRPQVGWMPDLNEGGQKSIRIYKIWGKSTVNSDEAWQYPTNSLHRFFKVTVDMP